MHYCSSHVVTFKSLTSFKLVFAHKMVFICVFFMLVNIYYIKIDLEVDEINNKYF